MDSEEIRDALNSMENSSVSGDDFSPDEDEYIPDSDSDTRSDDSIDEDLDISATNVNNTADEEQTETTTVWTSPATGETLKNFEEFTNPPQVLQYDAGTPFQYYRKFLTDEILDIIVEETNRNANSQVAGIGTRSSSRMNMWKDTDRQEIMEFLAIVMYMGMVKYPAITDYWKPSTLFKNAFVPQVMARNRFQILLKFIHFADNAQSSETVSKTYKIDKIVQELILAFKQNRPASQKLVIDESMIPFRGRLGFRQYLPGKAHKYGIKVFKLADTTGPLK
ncbi:piggyBac transposable element-derived protein 4-like [Anastrepha obliqua]|uniref:piggyBac transposable element-derived protein 4-like n=1 Tax=Anastrepha obliqua TaxID=95512 RepID=UPI0024090D64|nr:piggyBac transposable element-derived protein 4-like [Anastrepha obliqua]